ncbi:MAG: LysR substrate-binding domain-containing protein [Planctomycetota bacterium]
MSDAGPTALRLHQLEGFFHVALHGGFTRAAEAFPYAITEPALHQQVRKLERALGAALLIKGPKRKMVLTPAGRALFEFVRPFFAELPGVLRGISDGTRGELRVGTEPFYVEGLVGPLLARVRERAPEAELVLRELDRSVIATELQAGALDFGVCVLAGKAPRGLMARPLGRLGLELRVPASHPLAKKRPPLRPSDIQELPCLLFERGTSARDWADAAFAEAGLSPRQAGEASSTAALQSLVGAGLAPAFLPTLDRSRRPAPRKRENADGTVSFDLTRVMEQMAGAAAFGILMRAGEPAGLVALALSLV